MANILQELLNVCRFCLSEDLQRLQPIMRILDSTITPGDIDRYTGIRVNTDEDCTLYAICTECTNRLKNSIEYRTTCINNQKHYEELLMMLVASTECTDHEDTQTVICLDSDDDTMEFNSFEQEAPNQTHFPQAVNIQQEVDMLQEEDSCTDTIRSSNSTQLSMCNEEGEMYSANYIEPGEPYSSELSEVDLFEPTVQPTRRKKSKKVHDLSKFTDNYVLKSYKGGKRMYLKALCEVCGTLPYNIKKHMQNHSPETFYSCPQCPVKMKDKTNMKAHINTVHYKMVGKTCNLCGKGFIHHKTYRYHMLGHQSEGEAFECKVCGKTFNKPFGLSDHYKRVHNLAKALKRTS